MTVNPFSSYRVEPGSLVLRDVQRPGAVGTDPSNAAAEPHTYESNIVRGSPVLRLFPWVSPFKSQAHLAHMAAVDDDDSISCRGTPTAADPLRLALSGGRLAIRARFPQCWGWADTFLREGDEEGRGLSAGNPETF